MRKSIATVSVSGTLEEKLASIARANFDGIELFENDLVHSSCRPAEIAARVADLGLTIELYQPFRDFEAVPAELAAANLRRAERKFDVMEQLGAPVMLVCSNVSAAARDDDELAAEQLYRLAERAHERGLRIAYEALAWGWHVDDYRRSWRIVQAADHPHLGVCLDSFHVLSRRTDVAAIRDIPGEKIFFVQIADAPPMQLDALSWSRHYRCFPGQGGFDLAAFTAPILATGYRGPLSLEVFNDTFRQADSARTATDGMRSLLLLEEQVRSATGGSGPEDPNAVPDGGAADGRARQRIELFDPPAPVTMTGYAFVELALPPEATTPVAEVLTALGFRLAARHRSKPVTLFEQNGIRVLCNAAPGAGSAGVVEPAAAVGSASSVVEPAAVGSASGTAEPASGTAERATTVAGT
ncbi:MAG: sugar phosphate isomerase/epimerase and 4-hydroxyphenylpyruvate domain-containing protein, partial [Actinocatenispora sp.]